MGSSHSGGRSSAAHVAALPDEVGALVLSFLPLRDALRAGRVSVAAAGWRRRAIALCPELDLSGLRGEQYDDMMASFFAVSDAAAACAEAAGSEPHKPTDAPGLHEVDAAAAGGAGGGTLIDTPAVGSAVASAASAATPSNHPAETQGVPRYPAEKRFESLRALTLKGGAAEQRWIEPLLRELGGALDALSLVGCERLGGGVLGAIGEHCAPSLRSLSLSRCYRVEDGEYAAGVSQLRLLTSFSALVCEHLGVATARALADSCGSLRRVSFAQCRKAGNDAIAELARLTGLEDLDLDRALLVSGRGVAALARTAPPLQRLSLRSCFRVTDSSVAALARRGAFDALRELDVSGIVNVGDDALRAACHAACRTLSSLDISGCHRVGDETIRTAVASCAGLQSLALDKMMSVSDATIEALASGCSELRRLSLDGCLLLTDAAVVALSALRCLERLSMEMACNVSGAGLATMAQHCPWLERLNVRCLNKVDPESLEAVARSCPRLRVIAVGGVCDDDGTRDIATRVHAVLPACKIAM